MNPTLFGHKTDEPPPPPTWVEIAASTAFNICSVSMMVGFLGGVALYVCSFPATIAGVMFGDGLHFRDPEWSFLSWCGSLLDRHMGWFVSYALALFLWPLGVMWFLGLFGLGKLAESTRAKYGCLLSGKRYPGYLVVRLVAGTLFLPFVPTIVAAIASFMMGLLIMFLLGLYALVELGRFGGLRYFVTRLAVRDGMRDARGRRRR